jgi:hypothetical protein
MNAAKEAVRARLGMSHQQLAVREAELAEIKKGQVRYTCVSLHGVSHTWYRRNEI